MNKKLNITQRTTLGLADITISCSHVLCFHTNTALVLVPFWSQYLGEPTPDHATYSTRNPSYTSLHGHCWMQHHFIWVSQCSLSAAPQSRCFTFTGEKGNNPPSPHCGQAMLQGLNVVYGHLLSHLVPFPMETCRTCLATEAKNNRLSF